MRIVLLPWAISLMVMGSSDLTAEEATWLEACLEPRSESLSFFRALRKYKLFHIDFLAHHIIVENPELSEDYPALHLRVSQRLSDFFETVQVPDWFHWLHVAYLPELPPPDRILAIAPPGYPLSGLRLASVSNLWHAYCVRPQHESCIYAPGIVTHGRSQGGWVMTEETMNLMLDRYIQEELQRVV